MKEHKPDCFKPGNSLKKAHKNNPKKMEKEFVRQLGDQEKGLNKLTVGEYLENREKFLSSGRSGTGQAQTTARKKLKKDIANSIKRGLRKKGVGPAEAQKIAKERSESILDSLAALHDPDMVAGGHDKINRVANKKVNTSLGSQWRDRVKAMDKAAKKALAEHGPDAKMNVKLERCR